ncbi:MAG: 30S ribosomal protein S8 [Candidatus Daviesbacteria bacterium]|nr:30S ribosomal protein S8 [Candidatus Daviesbacteria bacterium]
MDNVSDALIRIKNGYAVDKQIVLVRYSKLIMSICQLLVEEGYLTKFEQKGHEIELTLKYNNRKPALSSVKRVSKPGLRVYKGTSSLPVVLNGIGMAIVSTPKGVMSGKKAKELKIGGEVLAEIW